MYKSQFLIIVVGVQYYSSMFEDIYVNFITIIYFVEVYFNNCFGLYFVFYIFIRNCMSQVQYQ